MSDLSKHTRLYREKLLADPYRPGYHFAIPDGNGNPGDPNGAFFADGRYHLMYLYRSEITDGFHWGHVSSTDLLHWRSHPDALFKGAEPGHFEGYFSGGAFVDDDQTVYLTFWRFPSDRDAGGIGIAFAKPPYDVWEEILPIPIEGARDPWGTMDVEIGGKVEHIACADPSNIWKQNGWYYLEAGNLLVLNRWGRAPDSEEKYKGDWTDLFRSKDLRKWEFVHRFYDDPHIGPDWPDATEDDMCPSLLPLPDRAADGKMTDKMFQLFIAHNKGAQYYVGTLKDERFYPEQHGRFSWVDNTCFAPEALIDPRNRHIGWYWLLDDPVENEREKMALSGWSGVYSFPRLFWLEDGALRIAPAEELDRLQYNPQTFETGVVAGKTALPVKNGASFRLRARIDVGGAKKVGFTVRADEAHGERTEIYADLEAGALVMDTTRSGIYGRRVREQAPFVLKAGEPLELDIFVDRSVVEVYANRRQAICRRVYPSAPAQAVSVFAAADGADFGAVSAWEMMETNLY